MIYLATSALLGMFTGWFSHRHQKLFLAAFAAIGGSVMLTFELLLQTLFNITGAADDSLIDLFNTMPTIAQDLVFLFFIAALATRVIVWVIYSFFYEDTVESKSQRRARILAEYGMADPLA